MSSRSLAGIQLCALCSGAMHKNSSVLHLPLPYTISLARNSPVHEQLSTVLTVACRWLPRGRTQGTTKQTYTTCLQASYEQSARRYTKTIVKAEILDQQYAGRKE